MATSHVGRWPKLAVGAAAAIAAVVTSMAAPAVSAQEIECPPEGFDSFQGFNITKYTGLDRWYVQEQMEILYLPLEWNYCVTARYNILAEDTVAVFNSAREGGVNGEEQGAELRAIIQDLSQPSKLSVGPIGLPIDFYGPYWVLAAGPENTDRYEWALISGGPPSIPTETGCRTRENTSNNSGLWIFARVPFPPPAQNAAVRDVAKSLGFDVSVLNKVEHIGCTYSAK